MSLPQLLKKTETGILLTAPRSRGQMGKAIVECKESLAAASSLILEDRREDAMRGLPEDAIREVVAI
jgi:hypothetical protein